MEQFEHASIILSEFFTHDSLQMKHFRSNSGSTRISFEIYDLRRVILAPTSDSQGGVTLPGGVASNFLPTSHSDSVLPVVELADEAAARLVLFLLLLSSLSESEANILIRGMFLKVYQISFQFNLVKNGPKIHLNYFSLENAMNLNRSHFIEILQNLGETEHRTTNDNKLIDNMKRKPLKNQKMYKKKQFQNFRLKGCCLNKTIPAIESTA